MPPLGRAALLIVGDVTALTAFAVAGRRTHDEAVGLAAVAGIIETALPFVAAWLVAALVLNATATDRTATLRGMVVRTSVAWIAAFPLVALFRGLLLGRASPWTFYVVTFVVAFLMLLGWRVLFLLAERRLTGRPATQR